MGEHSQHEPRKTSTGPHRSLPPGSPHPLHMDLTPVDGLVPRLESTLDTLTLNVGRLSSELKDLQDKPPPPEDSDERLTKVEHAVKWASPWKNLLALVAFLLVGAVAVVTSMRDYARDAVVETMKEAHKTEVEPTTETVEALKTELKTTGDGVQTLLGQQKRDKRIKSIEVELKLHDDQYQELLQDWSAKKAARRNPGEKPTKTPEHLALEAALRSALAD